MYSAGSKMLFALLGLTALTLVSASGQCGSHCNNDDQCTFKDCSSCIPQAKGGAICADGCHKPCTNSTECGDKNCPYCYKGMCDNSPHSLCGGECKIDADCQQGMGNHCEKCMKGKCTATCGQACKKNSECLGNGVCERCLFGLCAKDDVPCGGGCSTNFDCMQTSYCNQCIAAVCTSGCGQPCTNTDQCRHQSCKYCKFVNKKGTCESSPGNKKCHQSCGTNDDCTGSPGTCETCYNGKCASPCQTPCKENSDCVTPGCTVCSKGKCNYHN